MDPAATAYELVHDALLSPHDRIKILLASLPVLGKDAVDLDEPCPICLMPFSSVLADEADAGLSSVESNKEAVEKEKYKEEDLGGVTKLVGCGHIFCRRDLTEWIRSQHGSCPTCRHTFLNIRPPSESDDESSDGGEYIPNPDDFEDEDEDAFLDVDGFTDADAEEFPVEGMDLDFGELWEEGQSDAGALGDAEMEDEEDFEEDEADMSLEWGLTDGESESMSSSEGDTTIEEEGQASLALQPQVSISVHGDDDVNLPEGEGLDPTSNVHDPASQDPK